MKTSDTTCNIANWIAAHIAKRFPELAANPIPGVWFTGSNVWSLLYGSDATEKDWDIFTIDEAAARNLVTGMGWNLCPSFQTKYKAVGQRDPRIDPERHIPKLTYSNMSGCAYSEGYCYITPGGDVDVWVTSEDSALDEIRTYPLSSHAHCRVAFSFTDGLIILPNEMAGVGVPKQPEGLSW